MHKREMVMVALAFVLAAGAAVAEQPDGKPQTACPVSGKPIDKTSSPHVDFQGQRIYFCCDNCPAAFRKDPESFFAKAAEAGVVFENIQTSCPVSGETLGEGDMGEPVSIQYKGRTVKFCCKMCVGQFEKDPAKYLAKLPGEQPKAN
jgi:YHS domain-containing protein